MFGYQQLMILIRILLETYIAKILIVVIRKKEFGCPSFLFSFYNFQKNNLKTIDNILIILYYFSYHFQKRRKIWKRDLV
ncbi:hypothetical protein D5F93_08390 [Streptococcus agalactiae]|nr:hypothetical protein D5F93_08390 [Streptococcus agalactiae]